MSSESNLPELERRLKERKRGGSRGRKWWALGSLLAYWLWRRWQPKEKERESPSRVDKGSLKKGHEPDIRNARGIVYAGLGLAVSIGVILLLLWGFFAMLRDEPGVIPSPFASYEHIPPRPRLQEDPSVDLQALHQQENERLYSYGWVNRQEEIVHIPIERAMQLVVERGLPVRDTAVFVGWRDTMMVPTESGFTLFRRGPPSFEAPPYLGSSPEPFTTQPGFKRFLDPEQELREE